MTELDLRDSPWNEGLGIPSTFLDQQLYLLACIVHAGKAFDELEEKSIVELRGQFQETEVGRLLLLIAASIRNLMDQNPWRAEHWLEDEDSQVGTLIDLSDGNKENSLEFKEACHKIIHCLSINFDYIEENPTRGMALRPKVYLYGFRGDQSWKATIDINKYIHLASLLT